MNSNEDNAARDVVDLEFEFTQRPAQVWRALGDPDLVAQWLAPGDIGTEPGHRFDLQIKGGLVACEVLASEPERLLSYRWRTAADAGDLDTVVTFVLTETAAGGTHLRLVHSGFDAMRAAAPAANVIAFARPRGKTTVVCGGGLSWAA